jgi:hypothetical protein
MKSKDYLVKKYSYYNGNPDYLEEFSPYHGYYQPGRAAPEALDKELNYSDYFSDTQRDGKDFKEFEEFKKKRNKKLKRIKLLQKLKKMKEEDIPAQDKKDVFEPHPFYSSMYGYTGFEGAYTSPLEYYDGSIADEPGSQTINPYNSTWQLASDDVVKIIIRSMILEDFLIKSRGTKRKTVRLYKVYDEQGETYERPLCTECIKSIGDFLTILSSKPAPKDSCDRCEYSQ